MSEIYPYQPDKGIAAVDWRNDEPAMLPGSGQIAGLYGGKIRQVMSELYNQPTSRDTILNLTVPHLPNSDLLLQPKFSAALQGLLDKMEGDHPALAHVREYKANLDVLNYNINALQTA